MTECYRCGQPGHRRTDCPQDEPLPAPPRPSGQAARPPLRIIRDPAIARTWAQVIRDTLGWPRPPRNKEGDTP